MKILGLETSTAVCSVGLYREGLPLIEQSIQESHIHSEKLLTLVGQVSLEGGITLRELDSIAVSIGPGSFTGLRIGLSTAKGLSYALNKPLVSVATFDAIAEAARLRHQMLRHLTVLVDAKKEEWYIAQYDVVNERAIASMAVGLRSENDVAEIVRGSGLSLVLTDRVVDIKKMVGEGVTVQDVHEFCRGSVVASEAREKVQRREFSDVSSLEPRYLKDFFIRNVSDHSSSSMR